MKVKQWLNDSLLGMYLKTRNTRYINAFLLSVIAYTMIFFLGVSSFYHSFFHSDLPDGFANKVHLIVGLSGILLSISNFLAFRFHGVLPTLALGVLFLYIYI